MNLGYREDGGRNTHHLQVYTKFKHLRKSADKSLKPAMIDNRRNRRFVCGGLAQVHLQPGQATLPAKITELSRNGCRLIFTAPPTVQLDHILEVAFTVDQEPFRLRGQVRSTPSSRVKNEHVVGIEFVSPSTRTQDRLLDLLEHIATKQWKLGIYP